MVKWPAQLRGAAEVGDSGVEVVGHPADDAVHGLGDVQGPGTGPVEPAGEASGERHGDGRGEGVRPEQGGTPGAGAEPFARGAGHPVQDDREQHDRDAGGERGAHVYGGEGLVDAVAEAARADDGGDDRHRQRHHDRLVEAQQEFLAGQREAGGQQPLPGRGAERGDGLHHTGVGVAQAERGEPGHGRRRVHDGGEDGGGDADAEDQDDGQQVGEGREHLHGVEDRAQRAVGAVGEPGGEAEQRAEGDGREDGDHHQRERLEGGHPHAEQPAGEEGGGRSEREPDAGGPPGDEPRGHRDAGPARREQHQIDGAYAQDDGVADVAEEVQEQRVAVPVVDDPVAGSAEGRGEVDGERVRPGTAGPAGVEDRDEDGRGDGEQQDLGHGAVPGGALEQGGDAGVPDGRGDGGHLRPPPHRGPGSPSPPPPRAGPPSPRPRGSVPSP